MVAPRRELAELCRDIVTVPSGIEVSDVTLDSRRVERGGLFLACAGRRTHGLAALSQALERGARAVLWEPVEGLAPPVLPAEVHASAVVGLSTMASRIAGRFFDQPAESLRIAGITGTNGKTTTAWLLAAALERLGTPAAYMGTLGVGRVPDAVVPGEYTTADAVSVQRQLAAVRAAGADCIAMEVSSHALDQHRVADVRFRVAAFTNLTRDHLDYHGTMEAYGAAKARLFSMPHLESCVFNVDDAFGAQLALRSATTLPLVLTGRSAAARQTLQSCLERDVRTRAIFARDARTLPQGLRFVIEVSDESARSTQFEVTVPLVGDFNVDNALTTLGVLLALKVPMQRAIDALAVVTAPPGRMEAIVGEGRAMAIVDYAHTPDALAKALRAARAHCSGKLLVVFGCGGDRDVGKRPLMAAVAASMSDAIVITDDNPRSEPPAGIVADILAGLPQGVRATVLHDRAEAIRHAIDAARVGDVVLVVGKGHEDYQIIGTERRPFSDRAVIRAVYAKSGFGVRH